MTTHPMHLFDAPQAGPTGKPTPAIRLSPTTQNDVFLSALLETPTTKTVPRSPLQWATATVLHVVILATLIIVPLYTTGAIDLGKYEETPLVAPPPPPPPPPAAARTAAPRPSATRPKLAYMQGKLIAPASIPKKISLDNAAAAPDFGGVPGGVPGGQLGGALGGVFGGTGTSAPTPAPQQPAAKRIVRVGSNLKAPRQTYSVQPEYPVLAREAHIWGTVVVDAVIDEHGNVVQARAVNGHPLLIPSALKAVLQWKYEPTLLNGAPIAIEMEVTVHFNLGS